MFRIRLSTRGFKWLVATCLGLSPLLCGNASNAECGPASPDYTARRNLVIGEESTVSKVYVSGFKVREEQNNAGGKQTVVLRLPEQGVSYVVDPIRNEALRLPLPPRPDATTERARQTVETRPDGLVVRRFQLLSGGDWRDVSTTTCRPDGVMLEQAFTFIDPRGNMLAGRLTQSNIDVAPLQRGLFEIPDTVKMVDPRIRSTQPPGLQ
jgi:hypothetical protein